VGYLKRDMKDHPMQKIITSYPSVGGIVLPYIPGKPRVICDVTGERIQKMIEKMMEMYEL